MLVVRFVDADRARRIAEAVEASMLTITTSAPCPRCLSAELKNFGYGSEGGAEAIQAYLNPKFVSRAVA